jgi:SM-20-related protein
MPLIRTTLDIDDLTRRFSQAGRVRCADFLDEPYAQELLTCLEKDVDWSINFIQGQQEKELTSEMRADFVDTAGCLANAAYESAREGFSFHFEGNRRNLHSRDPQHVLPPGLQGLYGRLNSTEFLHFFRRVTSIPSIVYADLKATRYRAGDFLTFHTDAASDKRKVTFIINLTVGWKPSWGGLLQFLSPDGQIVDTFVPEFKVPQLHEVSFVTPFAQGIRYALSGWLYTA